MGYIYLITNKIDNKQYVGQTIGKDINKRWGAYYNVRKNQIGLYFYNALEKYRPENFKFEIICICFDSDCNKYEEEYIKKFNTLSPNGYNLREGGKNSKQHADSIEKRRIAIKGRPMKEEFIRRGKDNPMFGKNLSEEHKEKLCKGYTPERRKMLSLVMKERWKSGSCIEMSKRSLDGLKLGNEKIKKKVNCYSLDGNLIATYYSITEASKAVNGSHSTISNCCNGNISYKTCKGFLWKFQIGNTLPEQKIEGLKKPLVIKKDKVKVNCYSLENKLIATYDSIYSAAKNTDSSPKIISMCCNNKRKTHNKFIWKIAN